MKTGLRLLYNKKQIEDAIDDIIQKICEDKKLSKDFVVLCVLKGAFMFCADLIRQMPMTPQIDFIRVKSYENNKNTGKLQWLLKPSMGLEGRDVLIVEDIVDTGATVRFLRKKIRTTYGAKSVKVAALLHKKGSDNDMANWPEYAGLICPNRYVIGYGLDSNDKMRNLPQIYYME